MRPFTEKQIELVKNFAAQAVIAIENARLLNELRQRTDDLSEALEQQTATSEVLRVISSSGGELEPVFESILKNACLICEANFGNLFVYKDGEFRTVAMHNPPPAYADARRRGPLRPPPGSGLGRLAATKQVVQIADMKEEDAYKNRDPFIVTGVELAGLRTLLAVPMLQDGELTGAISMYRQEVRPFTDKQIELVQNFAAQAVIAIENARLLNELRQRTDDLSEALEQQTATSEVLKIISRSGGELQPVFMALLENATHLCVAKFGNLYLRDGDGYRTAAMHNVPAQFAAVRSPDLLIHAEPGSVLDRLIDSQKADSRSGRDCGASVHRAPTENRFSGKARRLSFFTCSTDAKGRGAHWCDLHLSSGNRCFFG